jgi:hypothetical protein
MPVERLFWPVSVDLNRSGRDLIARYGQLHSSIGIVAAPEEGFSCAGIGELAEPRGELPPDVDR